jgi:hypothetical protein
MIPFRSNTFWRPLRRRLPAVLALVAYLAAALGMPLPTPAHRDRSQPFPCQNHACGCQTAEQCWRHCCCFTSEEHWAWARANHVEPPTYAEKPTPEKPASAGWNTPRLRDQAEGKTTPSPHCARCAQTPNGQDDSEPHAAAGQSIPGTNASPPARDPCDPEPRPAAVGGWRLTLGVNSLCCQGLSTLWLTSGTTLPPPAPLAWVPWQAPAGWVCGLEDLPLSLSAPPPLPPPRLACA